MNDRRLGENVIGNRLTVRIAQIFEAILERYRKEDSPQLRVSLLGTLGRFRKPELIDRYLDLALSKDVRPQDIYIPMAWSFRNRDARDGVRHAAHLLSLCNFAERSAGTFKWLSK